MIKRRSLWEKEGVYDKKDVVDLWEKEVVYEKKEGVYDKKMDSMIKEGVYDKSRILW